MPKQVLIVDDDLSLATVLSLSLRRGGYEPRIVGDGRTALELARQSPPDVVLLDVMLPNLDGWETCRRLKAELEVPVLVITCRTEESDAVRSFRAGADDYMRKPFGLGEMNARIKALLRRSGGAVHASAEVILRVGELTLDMARCRITRAGETLDFSPTEYRLLTLLMQRAGRIVTYEEILRHVWGAETQAARASVMLYVRYLRSKLGDSTDEPRYIATVRGVGYRFLDSTS